MKKQLLEKVLTPEMIAVNKIKMYADYMTMGEVERYIKISYDYITEIEETVPAYCVKLVLANHVCHVNIYGTHFNVIF